MAKSRLFACSMLALAGVSMAQSPATDAFRRIDTPLNQFTYTSQRTPSVDASEDGRMVLAWASRRQEASTYGIFARLADAQGRPIGDEIHVNQFMPRAQMEPAVAVAGDAAWIAWVSEGQDGDQGAIIARRFRLTMTGLEALGGEIAVNTDRAGHQSRPSVACLEDGRTMIVWTSRTIDGVTTSGQMFDADGSAMGRQIEFADDRTARATQATVASRNDGFVVAWSGAESNGVPSGIFARKIDADGNPLSGVIEIASNDRRTIEPSIDTDASGGFTVGWLETASDASRLSGYGVMARRFDADGSPVGKAIIVAPRNEFWQSGVTVAMSDDGRFSVSYSIDTGEADADVLRPSVPSDVVARMFDADGGAIGGTMVVHESRDGHQASPGSPARRAVWGSREFPAFCWDGDTGRDGSGVAISSLVASDTEVSELASTVEDGVGFGYDEVQASASIPPIFDKNWVAPPPDNDIRPAGDFGFQAWNGTGWIPPDPDLSVGPNTIVGVVNVEAKIFDKQGNTLFVQDLVPFFSSVGASGFLFDPVAVFDRHSNRHIICVVEHTGNQISWINIAVSKTADPQNGNDWWKYRFNTTNVDGGRFIDYQNLGVDGEAIYVAADYFAGQGSNRIHIFDKAPMLNGQATTMQIIRTSGGFRSLGAVNHITGDAPAAYFATSFGNSNTQITIDAITNPLTNPQLVSRAISVPFYSQPPGAAQQGSGNRISTVDQRVKNGVYRNGSLWLTHNIGQDSVAQVRFYEIAMNGWPTSGNNPTLVQSGEIDLGAGIYTFFGDPGVDQDNNVVIQFNRSSSTEFVSIQRTLRLAGDTPGTVREPVEVQTSTSPDNSGRWGDYSGMEEDPSAPGVFWGHDEYVRGGWRTWIGQIDLASAIPQIEFVFPNGIPEDIDPNGTTIRVEVVATDQGSPEPGTGRLFFDLERDGTFLDIPMTEITPNVYDAILPPVACLDTLDFYFAADATSGDNFTDPPAAPTQFHSALSLVERIVAMADDFETDQGWIAENLGAIRGDWERGVPIDDPGWAFDPPSDGDGSGSCYLTQNTAGASDVDGGAVRLTSPLFDMSGGAAFTIDYLYYLKITGTIADDGILVEISSGDLAGPWTTVIDHRTDGGTIWRSNTISMSDLAGLGVTPSSTMRMRFTARDNGPDNNLEGGIDGFSVVALSCEASGCPADIDGDGDADADDFFAYLDLFASGDSRADIDGDGDIDADDFFAYLDRFVVGC